MQKKSSKSKLLFNLSLVAVIASAIVTASVMTGCSSDSKKDTKETEVVHETEVVTYEVNGVVVDEQGNVLDEQGSTTGETVPSVPKSDDKQSSGSDNKTGSNNNDKSSSKTESSKTNDSSSKTSSKSDSKSSAANGSSKNSNNSNNSNKNNNNNNNNNNSSSSSNQSSNNYNHDKSGNTSNSLKIGNKHFNVGDTVTCTYNVQNSEKLLNFQGYLKYDGSYLKVKTARLENSAGNSGMLNYDLNQEIRFNGSNLNGYNYTSSKAFLTVEYQVLKAGTTTPKLTWEVITGMSEKKYCDDKGNLINGFKVSTSYK